MRWVREEIFNGIGGRYPEREVTEFLNTLPEERALEAKIMICNTFAWIYYRTDDLSVVKEYEKNCEVEEKSDRWMGLKVCATLLVIILLGFVVPMLVVEFISK
jgi:hypothetical protein